MKNSLNKKYDTVYVYITIFLGNTDGPYVCMDRDYHMGWYRKHCMSGKEYKYIENNSSQLSANIASNHCHINT